MMCSCLDLLALLLTTSERAAELARVCRQSQTFQDVVQEKDSVVKNKKTLQDFKTVADVMVQSSVRHDIGAKYPSVAQHIFGEEDCHFTTSDGTSLELTVQESEQKTAELLTLAMGGAADAAGRMAAVVHGPPPDVSHIGDEQAERLKELSLPTDDLGVWIDPIDCTSEYVRGAGATCDSVTGVVTRGLPAVTVLVGVFRRSTGRPLLGVVTQPFGRQEGARWLSAQYWGVCCGELRLSNVPARAPAAPVVMTSSSERSDVTEALRAAGLRPVAASGAGFKLLQVALGSAAGFVVSLSSTFLWDTCGPDALLASLGGSLAFVDGRTIRYDRSGDALNSGCLVAALDSQTHQQILTALRHCDELRLAAEQHHTP